MSAYDELYNGDWANNCKMGLGDYTWPNGDRYSGEFISDLREGKGIFIWKNGSFLEGWWQADQLNGEAKYIDSDKKESDLVFLNGKLHVN